MDPQQPLQQAQKQPQPRNLFELINVNVVDMSKDLVSLHDRVVSMEEKVNMIYLALYPPMEEPNATGDVPTEE
mgnify:FL=1